MYLQFQLWSLFKQLSKDIKKIQNELWHRYKRCLLYFYVFFFGLLRQVKFFTSTISLAWNVKVHKCLHRVSAHTHLLLLLPVFCCILESELSIFCYLKLVPKGQVLVYFYFVSSIVLILTHHWINISWANIKLIKLVYWFCLNNKLNRKYIKITPVALQIKKYKFVIFNILRI